MSTEKSPPRKPVNKFVLGGTALAVIVGLGLYAFNPSDDNPAVALTCTNSANTVAAMEPFARGEVAAFQLAATPRDLSSISFKDKDGKDVTIADWKSRTVLLNMWATWCAPCLREMPALQKLQIDLGGDNFEVVPVSVDLGDDTKPKAFYKKAKLTELPFYADGTMEVFENLKKQGLAFGMPTTVIIDKNGCSLGVLNGPAEWASDDAMALVRAAF
jgi:thiol-disulfide isomerase/thioredoxin